MIDIDECKEVLEALKSGFLDIADIEPYMETICKALEKQIPKKPKREPDEPFPGEEGDCPCCEASVYFWDNKYCGYCGQALDWS